MMDKPHKKLDVWKKSIELVEQLYQIVEKLPRNEDYGLANQMRRASISIPANIAEGAARHTSKEFIQFLHISQGSLSEVDTYMEICTRLKYITPDKCSEMSALMDKVDKMLTGLIKSLKKKSV